MGEERKAGYDHLIMYSSRSPPSVLIPINIIIMQVHVKMACGAEDAGIEIRTVATLSLSFGNQAQDII
jgi:hypothetical protein